MKPLTLLFACAAALAALTTGATVGTAADQPAEASHREPGARLQELAARLDLTDEQKEQIAPILHQEIAELKELRENSSLRRMQRARRAREITDKASKQIRALLTPEQQVEYDALRAELRDELKQRAKERKNGAG